MGHARDVRFRSRSLDIHALGLDFDTAANSSGSRSRFCRPLLGYKRARTVCSTSHLEHGYTDATAIHRQRRMS